MARAIKIIPVRHLSGELPPVQRLPFGTLIGCAPGQDQLTADLLGRTHERPIEGLDVRVRQRTPLSFDDGNCTVDLVGDALLVTGSPDQIHLVEQTVQMLSACVGAPITLRAAAFHLEQGGDLPVLAPDYDALRARLAELGAVFEWEGTTIAASEQKAELGVRRSSQYVMDFEVEIAQSSTMSNPVPSPIHLGSRVVVKAHALTGTSDVVLVAQYARGEEVAPVRGVPLGKDKQLPRIEVPSVAIDFGTMSGRVPSGGALLALAEGVWAGRRYGLIVGAQRTAPPPELERELGAFPLGAFLDGALREPVSRPLADLEEASDPFHGDARWSPPLGVASDWSGQIDPAGEAAWEVLLRQALGEEDATVELFDDVAWVQGSPAAKQTVGRLIEQLQDQFLRTVEVECRLDAEPNRPAIHRLRHPVLLGRHHVAVHGVETTSIVDFDVEVAQKAGIADPKVVRQFTGTEFLVQAFPMPPQDLGAKAEVRTVQTVPARTFVPETEHGLPIDQPVITQVRHRHFGRIPQDGVVRFGSGPEVLLDQRPVATRQSLAIRAR